MKIKWFNRMIPLLLTCVMVMTSGMIPAIVSGAEVSGVRMEAEDQGTGINLYATHNDTTWKTGRGIVVVSNADYSKGTLPTYEGLNDGSYTLEQLKNTPYIAYKVTVNEPGTYKVTVGYMISGGNNASHNMLIYANSKAYKAPYTSTNFGWAPYSESQLRVDLIAGENTIYCIPFDKNYMNSNSGAWLNQDYLELGDRVTPRQEAEDQGENINLYATHNDTTWKTGRGIVVVSNANYTKGILPTYEGLNNGSYTMDQLKNVPYIAYNVTVTEAGTYKLTVGYMISGGDNASHYMLLYSNGVAYKAPYTSTNPSWAPYSESEIEIALKAGENIVYCIPFDKAYADSNSGVFLNQDYLELGAQVSTEPPVKEEYTRIEAEAQGENINLYATHNDTTWQAGRGIVVVSNADYSNGTLPTYEGLNDGSYTAEQLQNVPYVAYKIKAEAAGEYKLKLGYIISGGDNASHYMLVYVNGKAYKANYTLSTSIPNWAAYSESEITVSLNLGENTLYCIPFDKNYMDANSGAFLNQDYLGIPEGLEAVVPSGPGPVVSEYTRMEAEEYALVNKYANAKQEFAGTSGGYVVGDGLFEDSSLLPYSAFKEGVDLSKQAYVQYAVNAATAGEYTLRVGYILGERNDPSKQYVIVFVNGKTPYKAYYHKVTSWAAYSESSVTVQLQSGENTITCISFDADQRQYNPKAWLNPDYLDIPKSLEPLRAQSPYVRYEAEDWAMTNNYSNPREKFEGTSGGYVVGGASFYNENLLPFSAYKEGVDLVDQSYVEYTVKANEAGQYRLGIGYILGNRQDASKQYIVVFVNGKTAYKAYYEKVSSWEAYSEASVTVSLNAGENTITCIPFDKDQREYNPKAYVSQDYITIPRALEMLKPGKIIRYESEQYAMSNLYNNPNELFKGMSDDHCIGGASCATGDLPTWNELSTGKAELGNVSFVQYTIEAPKAGVYSLRFGYVLGSSTTDRKKHYMPVMVNNKTAYKAKFTSNPSWPASSISTLKIELKKGSNTIICIPYDQEYRQKNANAWLCHDYVEMLDTLTMVKPESMKPVAAGFVRFEAEHYTARTNYKVKPNVRASGEKMNAPIYYSGAQTIEDIRKNGIDSSVTPNVQYTLNALKSGEYQLEFGMFLGHEGSEYINGGTVYIALEINGKLTEIKTSVTEILPQIYIYKIKAALKEGNNVIRISSCTSDSTSEDRISAAYAYQDYLDVTKGVTAISYGERLEAENSEINGYIREDRASASGGKIIAKEDSADVIFAKLTFDKLDTKTLAYAPHVAYELEVEKAGSYTIVLGLHSSQLKNVPEDVTLASLGVMVNGGKPQKVEYTPGYYLDRAVDVELQAGSNKVVVTGILYDLHQYSGSSGSKSWVDQDYLELPEGVTGVDTSSVAEFGIGDNESNINDSQLMVNTSNIRVNQDVVKHRPVWIIAGAGFGVAILAAAAIWFILSRKRKRKMPVYRH